MKEKVEIRKIFILRDRVDRLNLYLHLGCVVDADTTPTSLRWMIRGSHNPMPVRNGTWFEGFNVSTMLRFFESNGFTCVDAVALDDYSLQRNEAPTQPQKENAALYDTLDATNKFYFDSLIDDIDEAGNIRNAIRLYRLLHGSTTYQAQVALKEMREKRNA